jgi:hypothetical protein
MANVDGGFVYQDVDHDWYAFYNNQMFGSFGSSDRASEFLEMIKEHHIKIDSYVEYINDRILEAEQE